jgi:hypothetical protein
MQRRKQAKTRLARTGNKLKVLGLFNNMCYLVVMQFVTKIPQTDFKQSESLSKIFLGDSSSIIFFILIL